MRSARKWLGAAALGGLVLVAGPGATAQQAAAFRVVVHPDTPVREVAADDLSDIFMKRKTRWEDGSRAMPVDQVASSGTREAFARAVLGRSTSAMVAYWQQQIFSGRGVPPPEVESDQAVIDYVSGHAGAVGYISPSVDLRGVRVVEVRR